MSFFLDTQETSQRFGNEIVELCALLDANHIPHGSPDDFFEFAKMLENNSQFRIDLSALVKSVVNKDTDKLLLTDMMSMIANSVGGPSVTETYVDITKPTTILMEFLLGTGCWRQFGSPSPQPVQNKTPSFKPSVHAEKLHAVEIPNSSSDSRTNRKVENRASLLEVSNELRQTLSRLEFNTLQVKLHLDSIEQRISTIEDPPHVSPTPTSSPPEPLLHLNNVDSVAKETTQLHIEETPTYEVKFPTRGRAVFSPPYQDHVEDISSPTFAYATEKGRSIIPVGVFLVLLAIVATCFFVYSGGRQRLLKDGILHLKTLRAHFSSSTHATTYVPPPAVTLPPAQVPTSVPTSTTPASSPAVPTASTKGTAEIIPRPSTASNDAAPVLPNPQISYIPANVMEGRLLSAPRPEYPLFARTNRLEGQVALQATISKTGSIKTLHVIKGPIPLRSSAIDAVSNWRYKPYLINGRPTDVITTVYVDFSLRPPPTIAH